MGRPTIADLAEAAGVSASTVKRVISGAGVVRPGTMERVRAIAEEIGFYGLGSIRSGIASRRPHHTFRFIMQNPNADFCQAATEGLEAAVRSVADRTIRLQIDCLDDLSPEHVATRLDQTGPEVEAVGIVAADHPIITEAVDRAAARGVRVFALVSLLSARSLTAMSAWTAGRSDGPLRGPSIWRAGRAERSRSWLARTVTAATR